MTPQPPSSPDGTPLPPRHRPMLGDLAKDTTEIDLWAFEDDLEEIEEQAPPGRSPASSNIPAPREAAPSKKSEPAKPSGQKTPDESSGKIRMNVNKPRLKSRPAGSLSGQAKPESDFDDLEAWDDVPAEPAVEELPFAEELPEPLKAEPVKAVEDKTPAAEPAAVDAPAAKTALVDEFSPATPVDAKPISLRPHLGLNSIERIGLIGLAALLLGGSIWFLATTVFRLPKPAVRLEARDFPIKGEKIRVDAAACYWRKPITEGKDADACRLGTLLLPVVDLKLSGGSAMIRVFFKDDEGNTIGDPIIRQVGEGTTKVAATAGIEDPGIFAAYRTGNSTRWTVQVFEIPAGDITKGKSNKLFEMEIPAERR